MSAIDIPSHKEIYYIAFITQHGWEPDYNTKFWKKEGHSRLAQRMHHDEHGYFTTEEPTEWFDLEDAYWEALNEEE